MKQRQRPRSLADKYPGVFIDILLRVFDIDISFRIARLQYAGIFAGHRRREATSLDISALDEAILI